MTVGTETDSSTFFSRVSVLVPSVLRESAPIALTVVCHGVAAWLFFRYVPELGLSPQWRGQSIVLIGLSLGTALYAHARPGGAKAITAKLLQLIIHVVAAFPTGSFVFLDGVLLCVFACDIGMVVPKRRLIPIMVLYMMPIPVSYLPIRMWDKTISSPSAHAHITLVAFGVALLVWNYLVARWEESRRSYENELRRMNQTITLLSKANLDFQNYAEKSARRSSEVERRRIAREIHDTVGYTMVNMMMMIEAAKDVSGADRDKLLELLDDAREQAQIGLSEVRRAMRSLRDLRPRSIHGRRRYYQLARVFSNATNVSVQINFGNAPDSFGDLIDDIVYRIIQEGLTNSFRHGRATNISIYFWIHEDHTLRVLLLDNGTGSDNIVPGIGIEGMQERLTFVNGTLEAFSDAAGFHLAATIPLDVAEERTIVGEPGMEGLTTL